MAASSVPLNAQRSTSYAAVPVSLRRLWRRVAVVGLVAGSLVLTGCSLAPQSGAPPAPSQVLQVPGFAEPAPGLPTSAYREALDLLGIRLQQLVPLAESSPSAYDQELRAVLEQWSTEHATLQPALRPFPPPAPASPVVAVGVNAPEPLCLWFDSDASRYLVVGDACEFMYEMAFGITFDGFRVEP